MSSIQNIKRVVIYGAGYSGRKIISEISKEPDCYEIVALIDDDPKVAGTYIEGVKVNGGIRILPFVLKHYQVDEIIVAITYLAAAKFQYLLHLVQGRNIAVRTVPSSLELTNDDFTYDEIRSISIEDLLHREVVNIENAATRKSIRGRRVLVTGGGGSIGSVIAKKILAYGPKELFLLGHGENSIFESCNMLTEAYPDAAIRPVIMDIRSREQLDGLFSQHAFDIVFHAAAHKHVGLMEANVRECFVNNVIGTRNVLDAAVAHGVKKFVAISTDKAVYPVSIMGVSKRIVERYLASRAGTKTTIAAVRFGNVLGSRGSVVPIFERQIEKGGPVTVTGKNMRRYFMTIGEAASLVIEASRLASGNDLFVLDMGQPVRIALLAAEMIRLKGKQDIVGIRFVKPKHGEKLNEALFFRNEAHAKTAHKKIWRVVNTKIASAKYQNELNKLIDVWRTIPEEKLMRRMRALAAM
ncbi:MAG: polysaccharide biosynthesis protein [Spirochaetes bacterium]|nr:polysaccharide biosynthesis protein [Spirochaetota bacterium]